MSIPIPRSDLFYVAEGIERVIERGLPFENAMFVLSVSYGQCWKMFIFVLKFRAYLFSITKYEKQ